MPRPTPSYIPEADIAVSLSHSWNDDHPVRAFHGEVPRLEKMINQLSRSGALVFAAACAEWVSTRLRDRGDCSILDDVIDACRAAAVDVSYVDADERNPNETLTWQQARGRVQGPIIAASKMLGSVLFGFRHNWPLGGDSVCLLRLVEHIVSDVKQYRKWRDWALQRIKELDSNKTNVLFGNPIPIEALDPQLKLDSEQASSLLSAFLENLDPKENRFIRPAEEMVKAGFKGTPYKL